MVKWENVDFVDIPKKGLFKIAPIYGSSVVRGEDASDVLWAYGDYLYHAQEDPDDGYRSMLGTLCRTRISELPKDGELFQAMRRSEKVTETCVVSIQDGYSNSITFTSLKTEQPIFRVGTDNTEDYYPWFVSEWMPQGLQLNEERSWKIREQAEREQREQAERDAMQDLADNALF